MSRIRNLWAVLTIFLFILIWEVIVRFELIPAVLFPSPLSVFRLFLSLNYWQTIIGDICYTIIRVLIGFCISMVIGPYWIYYWLFQ